VSAVAITRVLIVEDDRHLGPLLVRVLASHGYEATLVASAASAKGPPSFHFDLAVVDWMLPDGDGLEVCTHLRRHRFEAPILMLTAKSEKKDRVRALDVVVDDYLTKPFDMDELLVRLRALARRSPQLATFDVGPIHIDLRQRYAFAGGVLLQLTVREFDLLAYLARCRDQAVPKTELLESVWEASELVPGVVEVCVSRLREKLGRHAWAIETIRGVGYRLRAEQDA